MKTLASLAFGAFALTAASIALAQPASARDVGIHVGPSGFGISVETYRNYCRDGSYRREHWNYCQRFYRGRDRSDYGYYNSGDGYFVNRDDHYRDRQYYERDGYRWRHYDRDDDGYDNDWDDDDEEKPTTQHRQRRRRRRRWLLFPSTIRRRRMVPARGQYLIAARRKQRRGSAPAHAFALATRRL